MQRSINVHARSLSVLGTNLAPLRGHGVPPTRSQQLPRFAGGIRQAPLERLKVATLLPLTDKPGQSLGFGAFDPEANVDGAVQLVQLASNPRGLAGKVDFVAEQLAGCVVGAQGVQDGADGRGGRLLVVEDGEAGGSHKHKEYRQRLEPNPRLGQAW